MQKQWIARSMTCAVALGGLLAGGAVRAESQSPPKKLQVHHVTCEEFLTLSPDKQERIAYWIDGYQHAKKETVVHEIAVDDLDQPIAILVDDCKQTPKATLWAKIKSRL